MHPGPTAPGGLPPSARRILAAYAGRLSPDPVAALADARAHRVPVSVLDGMDTLPGPLRSAGAWRAAVEEDARRADRLARAVALVEVALAGTDGTALSDGGLGPAWSSDVDVYVRPDALEPAGLALAAAAAVPLDGLRHRLRGGRLSTAPRLFAAVEGGEVLGPVELSARLWDGGPPAADAVARAPWQDGARRLPPADAARRRAAKLRVARRATVRGLAEMAALSADPGRAARRRHARLAARLGVPDVVAAPRGPVLPDPAWARTRARGLRERVRRNRARQLRVALCGIDGAGKSTQVERLVVNLGRAGIPAAASWARLGNRALAPVERAAAWVQRLLPAGTHSYQAARVEAGRRAGASHAAPPVVPAPLTRRGPLGWSWALVVTLDFAVRTRAAQHRARGSVLVLDRSRVDALVALEDDFGVALRLPLQRWLLERLTPRSHLTFYLKLPGAVAKARKDDSYTSAELEAHRVRYEALLGDEPGVAVLDAQRPRDELAAAILTGVANVSTRAAS